MGPTTHPRFHLPSAFVCVWGAGGGGPVVVVVVVVDDGTEKGKKTCNVFFAFFLL